MNFKSTHSYFLIVYTSFQSRVCLDVLLREYVTTRLYTPR